MLPNSIRPRISELNDTVVRSTVEVQPDVGGSRSAGDVTVFRLPQGTIFDLATARLSGTMVLGNIGDSTALPAFAESVIRRLEIRTASGVTLMSCSDYGEIASMFRLNVGKYKNSPVAVNYGWDVVDGNRVTPGATSIAFQTRFALGMLSEYSPTQLWATDLLGLEVRVTWADPAVICSRSANTQSGSYEDYKLIVDALMFEQSSYERVLRGLKEQGGVSLKYGNVSLLSEHGGITTALATNDRFTSGSIDAIVTLLKASDYMQANASGSTVASDFQTSIMETGRTQVIVNGHVMASDVTGMHAYALTEDVHRNLGMDFAPFNWAASAGYCVSLQAPRSQADVGSSGLNSFTKPGTIQVRITGMSANAKVAKTWVLHTSTVTVSESDMVTVLL